MIKILAFAIGTTFGMAAHAATETLRYDRHLESGKRTGGQVVEYRDDGTVQVTYGFKNNGRGPDLVEQIRLAPDGTMSQYSVKGNSTFGAVVDESFERRGDRASWKSTTEQGEKTVSGAAMYLPLNSSPHVSSLTVGALAARAGAALPLLPSGSLSQRQLDEMQVSVGGKTQLVHLVAQTGIGFSPRFLWVTSGPKPRLFASIAPGTSYLVEEGWDSVGKQLGQRQAIAQEQLHKDMASRLQHPLAGLTVVRNVRIFDSESARVGAPSDVYVLRGRISAVLPAGSAVTGAAQEIDGAGRIMLPGLFEMHGHVSRGNGGMHLAAGVTTVRDMGNRNHTVQEMLDEIERGTLLSPRVVTAGLLEGESAYSWNSAFVIKDLAGARNAIDWYAGRGYPQLKIYNSFPKEILRETVAYAHQRGLYVSGHIPVGLRAHEALDAGYDEINHINQVMLNFLATPQTETRSLERFILPAEKTASIDFNGKPVKDFVARLAKQGTVIDATLTAFDFLKHKDGDMTALYAPIAAHMPPEVSRRFTVGTMKIADAAAQKRYEASYAKMVAFVGQLYRAGVPLVVGTDDMAGFGMQAELELLVQAGLTPAQALQLATRNGARYTRTSHERGSVTVGKLADLVLVDGDPTKNMADIRKVVAVITRGYLIYPHEVHKELGIVPFVKDAPLLRAVQTVAVK
ncbi:MAG: amidohydrolase family protein [Pseudomonadota bacterium]